MTKNARQGAHHVNGGGTQGSGTCKSRGVPVRNGLQPCVVAPCEPPFPTVRRCNARVWQTQGFCNSLAEESLVRNSGSKREHVAEKPHPQVGVFVLCSDVPLQLIGRQKPIELFDCVVGE